MQVLLIPNYKLLGLFYVLEKRKIPATVSGTITQISLKLTDIEGLVTIMGTPTDVSD